jgi:hypothetical protein
MEKMKEFVVCDQALQDGTGYRCPYFERMMKRHPGRFPNGPVCVGMQNEDCASYPIYIRRE